MASYFSHFGWNTLVELKPKSPEARKVANILISKIAENPVLASDVRFTAALIAYSGQIIATSKFEEIIEQIGIIKDLNGSYIKVARYYRDFLM